MKRAIVIWFCLMLMISQAHAQAVAASALGQEIASVIKWKAAARGFAANDPRYGAVVGAVGGAVAEIATGAVIAGTAPAWGAILATAALGAAASYGINALAGWLFNKDGTATYPSGSSGPGLPAGYQASVSGSAWCISGWPGYCASSAYDAGYLFMANASYPIACTGTADCSILGWDKGANANQMYVQVKNNSTGSTTWQLLILSTPPSNMGTCAAVTPAGCSSAAAPASSVTKPVAEALNNIPANKKSEPLEPKVVADIADAAWRNAAAKPGYAGIPYSMSDPVTASDVAAARAANPSQAVATIGDLAQPIPSTNPLGEPATSPTQNPGTNPAASQPQVNLGTDPVIGAPQLEPTPTGTDILRPLTNLMPDLKNYQVPAHVGECPKPTFQLFGKSILMDGQCTLFEDIRGQLYNAMLVSFLIIALFIVLSA